MKKSSTHSKTSLFLMEMIFVLLFLSVSSAACIRIFAAAKENQTKAQEWRHIQLLTTSVGEILESSDNAGNNFLSFFPDGIKKGNVIHCYYDKNWNSCSSTQAVYEMVLKSTDSSGQSTLSFYTCSDSALLYTIDLRFPVIRNSEEAKIS